MEKIIEIDLFDKYDLTEKYNDKHLSSELLEYIIEQASFVTKRDTVKIVINKNNTITTIPKTDAINKLKLYFDFCFFFSPLIISSISTSNTSLIFFNISISGIPLPFSHFETA